MHEEGHGQERGQGHRRAGRERCQECGLPRAGGEPCGCAAEGEEFSPLRVRPYVTAGEEAAGTDAPAPPAYGGSLPEATMRLPRVPAGLPVKEPRARRRRTGVYATAGAGVVAAGAVAALLAGGASSPDPAGPAAGPGVAAAAEPGTERTDTRAAAPSGTATGSPSAAPGTTAAASPSASPDVSATGAAPGSSASASASSAAGASEAASPLPTRTAVRKLPTAGPSEQRPPEGVAETGRVLRRGDRGAEVQELEERLRLVGIYPGRTDGRFDRTLEYALGTFQLTRGVTDERGVYGADTRAELERETAQWGQ